METLNAVITNYSQEEIKLATEMLVEDGANMRMHIYDMLHGDGGEESIITKKAKAIAFDAVDYGVELGISEEDLAMAADAIFADQGDRLKAEVFNTLVVYMANDMALDMARVELGGVSIHDGGAK